MEQIKQAKSNIVEYAESVVIELEKKYEKLLEKAKSDYLSSTVEPEILELQKARDAAIKEAHEEYTRKVNGYNTDYNTKCESLKQKAMDFVEKDERIKFDAEISSVKTFIQNLKGE